MRRSIGPATGLKYSTETPKNSNAVVQTRLTRRVIPVAAKNYFFDSETSDSNRRTDKMNHIAALEEQMVSERMRQKLYEVNAAAQSYLSPIQDHVNFTLQQAYFKCAYECFDRRRKHEEIGNCVENCSVPVLTAQQKVENEMAKFQERLNRSLMVCQDKFETAKLQHKTSSIHDLETCVEQSIQENMKALPHLAEKLKASFSIKD